MSVYKYKMNAYRTDDGKLFNTEQSNNLEYFDKYKSKCSYLIEIFQRVGNRWKLIYTERY